MWWYPIGSMYGIYYADTTVDILMGSMSPYIPYMDPMGMWWYVLKTSYNTEIWNDPGRFFLGWHQLTSFLHHASSCLRFGNPPAELFRETPGPKLCHWIQRSYMDELADLHGFGCGSTTLMQFMYAPEGSIDSLLSLLSFNISSTFTVLNCCDTTSPAKKT